MTPKMAEIVARLEASRRALLESVDGLSQEAFDARPAEGSWSPGEILHHVARIEQGVNWLIGGALERAGEALVPDPAPEASVLASVEHLPVEDRSIRVQAPEFVHPTHGLSREEILETLAKVRATLLETVERASAYDLRGLTHPHPMFGPLNVYEWLLVTAKHERRHTAQIREALGATAAAPA